MLDVRAKLFAAAQVEGCTPIAAWVAPTSPTSTGVALFSEVEGVELESMDAWQLAAPQHSYTA